MGQLDKIMEYASRKLAQQSSRRSLLAGIATAVFGAASMPLLPVARAAQQASNGYPGVGSQTSGIDGDPGDPSSCDYWRYCAIDGYLCSCCGGSVNACPPGTEMSPITWIGTCLNPADGKNYIISYNDCCGSTSCARCLCNRNENDKPTYRPQANNDINWCLGTKSNIYTCTTGVVLGVASDQ